MTKLLGRLLVLAILAGSGAGAWKAWRAYEARHSPRIVVLDPAVAGVERDCAIGLGRLLRDQLEVSSASTVIIPSRRRFTFAPRRVDRGREARDRRGLELHRSAHDYARGGLPPLGERLARGPAS